MAAMPELLGKSIPGIAAQCNLLYSGLYRIDVSQELLLELTGRDWRGHPGGPGLLGAELQQRTNPEE